MHYMVQSFLGLHSIRLAKSRPGAPSPPRKSVVRQEKQRAKIEALDIINQLVGGLVAEKICLVCAQMTCLPLRHSP